MSELQTREHIVIEGRLISQTSAPPVVHKTVNVLSPDNWAWYVFVPICAAPGVLLTLALLCVLRFVWGV